ncbi:MAG: response regulator transcription factor [Verrucomicrobia bacterium]|nr:response regulator transcription factor [Verrucomicrobiota bacterium]
MSDSKKLRAVRARTKVLLVDDHPVLREGMGLIINNEEDLEVCGHAESADEAMKLVALLKPDLAIVDISLKDSDGIHLVKNLKARHPELLTLVLSLHDEALYAERALRAGASGYVMKQSSLLTVLAAIRKILDGGIYVSEKITDRMLAHAIGAKQVSEASPMERLSDREREVFHKIGEGFGTKEIAERLHLSVKTVETYRAHIKTKLQIAAAAEMIQKATLWVREVSGG